jgi:hypothetical protein
MNLFVCLFLVNDSPPEIDYPDIHFVGTLGGASKTINPENSGGAATSWSVFPPLPMALTLNPTTGSISGQLINVIVTQSLHTVTAYNSGGSGLAVVYVTSVDPFGEDKVEYNQKLLRLTVGAFAENTVKVWMI